LLRLEERPGLGTALREDVLRRSDVHIETTTVNSLRNMSHA
jgi:hypothetical protein